MNSFAFDAIAPDQRVPGSQAEFSNVRALQGLPAARYKILIIGQCIGAASVAAPVRLTQKDQGAAIGGRGSIFAAMVAASIAAGTAVELWGMPIADNAAGVAATGTITIAGTATAAGTLPVMIGGARVQVGVAAGATAATVATALAAAINALPDLPVTAAAVGAVVTLTCRHKGTAGNELDVRTVYYDGEAVPAGLTATIVSMAGGATNPDLTSLMASLGDEQYQAIVLGMNDTANLSAVDADLASRWGPVRQIEGRAYAGVAGTFSTLSTFGAARNNIHLTLIGANRVPSPPWVQAAGFATIAAASLQADPARPMTDLVVPGLVGPRTEHRFTQQERNLLLKDGISTFRVDQSGQVLIERLITTYQVNSAGFDDVSYLDITTPATLGYLRYSWRARMAQKFPRAKLPAAIEPVRAETIAIAREWAEAELIEDVDGFIAGLIVERDATNRTQLNLRLTPDVANGLLQLAARIEFIL